MEEDIFLASAVAEVLEREYVEARLHTDGDAHAERIKERQDKLVGHPTNPVYVLQDPKRTEVILESHEGYAGAETFAEFLKVPLEERVVDAR